MEDGGGSLFDFIQKAHQLIKDSTIAISHWQQVVKVIFKQMLEAIEYIHSKNVCHFDISLENFIINDVQIVITKMGDVCNMRFVIDDIRVKLCDFGMFTIRTYWLFTSLCIPIITSNFTT